MSDALIKALKKQDELTNRLIKVLEHDTREGAIAVVASWMGNERLEEMVKFLEDRNQMLELGRKSDDRTS